MGIVTKSTEETREQTHKDEIALGQPSYTAVLLSRLQ